MRGATHQRAFGVQLLNVVNYMCLAEVSSRRSYSLDEIELRSFGTIAPLRAIWEQLQDVAPTSPFQSVDWLESWWRNVGQYHFEKIHLILGVSPNGEPLFILPFGIRSSCGLQVIEWLGDSQGFYRGAIVHPEFLETLAPEDGAHILKLVREDLGVGDLFVLRDQQVTTAERSNPFVLKTSIVSPNSSSISFLDADWKDFDGRHRTGRTRRKAAQQLRNLAKLGKVDFMLAVTAEDKRAVFEALVEQKSTWLVKKGTRDFFSDDHTYEFIKELAVGQPDKAGLKTALTALTLDGTPIATLLSVSFRDNFSALILANSEGEWVRWSPGHLLIEQTLKWACENDFREFDMGPGEAGHKPRWRDETAGMADSWLPITVKGHLASSFIIGALLARRQIKSSRTLTKAARVCHRLLSGLRDQFKKFKPSSPVRQARARG